MSLYARIRLVLLAACTVALLATLVARAASAGAPSPVRLRRFALLIGVNDGGGGRARLRYAVSDARAVARVLASMGGVAPADLVFVSDPSRAAILAAFQRMDELVRSGAAP